MEANEKPLPSFTIPKEFYEDLDKRIEKKVAEAIKNASEESNPKKGYITRKELCARLRISLPTSYHYTELGILFPVKIGNRVLFEEKRVEDSIRNLSSQ